MANKGEDFQDSLESEFEGAWIRSETWSVEDADAVRTQFSICDFNSQVDRGALVAAEIPDLSENYAPLKSIPGRDNMQDVYHHACGCG